jgi:hypothetical protein
MREHYGRGPIKAKTYVLDNLIVCVLSDSFTAIDDGRRRTRTRGGGGRGAGRWTRRLPTLAVLRRT